MNRDLDATILRHPAGFTLHTSDELRDPLGPAKGVLLGLALAVPFWALVGYLIWRAFR